MRGFAIALTLLSLTNCSKQSRFRFIPRDFEYPFSAIGDGKTFVYHDSTNNQDAYMDLRSFIRGNDTVNSYLDYTSTFKKDSELVVNDKLIESYYPLSTLYPKMYKGEDLVDQSFKDETGLKRNTKSRTYHSDTLKVKSLSESRFEKDTSIIWEGLVRPCMVIRTDATVEVGSSMYAGLNFTSTSLIFKYYAKNIGVIRNTIAFKDKKGVDHFMKWDLVAIDDISKNKQK
jgi:hypothetical protein